MRSPDARAALDAKPSGNFSFSGGFSFFLRQHNRRTEFPHQASQAPGAGPPAKVRLLRWFSPHGRRLVGKARWMGCMSRKPLFVHHAAVVFSAAKALGSASFGAAWQRLSQARAPARRRFWAGIS